MDKLINIYESLLKKINENKEDRIIHKAKNDIIHLKIEQGTSLSCQGRHGTFHPEGYIDVPTITICRRKHRDNSFFLDEIGIDNYLDIVKELPQEDIIDEIITLAHETGHYVSFKKGYRTKLYVEAAIKFEQLETGKIDKLDEGTQATILEEENRAWNYAESVLKELGFNELPYFQNRKKEDLHNCVTRLDAINI